VQTFFGFGIIDMNRYIKINPSFEKEGVWNVEDDQVQISV